MTDARTRVHDGQHQLLLGDVRDALGMLADQSVHCVVTSPPFWPQRNYGIDPVVWGGNGDCRHTWGTEISGESNSGGLRGSTREGAVPGLERRPQWSSRLCQQCDAWLGCLGLEPTPSAYAAHLVDVFAAVWRVLRDDGTLWLNLGDAWAGSGGAHKPHHANPGISRSASRGGVPADSRGRPHWGDAGDPSYYLAPGLKPLDLIGLPWMVAFALRDWGWYLRSAVLWEKRNGSPESVMGPRWERHRVKTAVGLYQFERASVAAMPSDAEGHHPGQVPRREGSYSEPSPTEWEDCPGCPACAPNDGLILRRGNWRPTQNYELLFLLSRTDCYYTDWEAVKQPTVDGSGTKNLRAVWRDIEPDPDPYDIWTLATASYKGAHYAVFPVELAERAIKAGTSEAGVCAACGAPWARVLDRVPNPSKGANTGVDMTGGAARTANPQTSAGLHRNQGNANGPSPVTMGWRPTCACGSSVPVPSTVLDPFCGVCTTSVAARNLGRRSIGIDISERFLQLGMERLYG